MRTIYEPQGRAAEYSALALNLYEGCRFGCTYCFNTKMPWCDKERFGKAFPRIGVLEALEKKASSMAGDPREILLSFTCDPYPGPMIDLLTREALLILEKYKMKVQILSKAAETRDFDILERNGWRYGITVTGDNISSSRYEPGAAPVWDRICSLSRAHHAGIKTFVSFEPIIDDEFCLHLMAIGVFQTICDEVRIGKMNYDRVLSNAIDWKKFLSAARIALQNYPGSVIIKKELAAYGNEPENSETLAGELVL